MSHRAAKLLGRGSGIGAVGAASLGQLDSITQDEINTAASSVRTLMANEDMRRVVLNGVENPAFPSESEGIDLYLDFAGKFLEDPQIKGVFMSKFNEMVQQEHPLYLKARAIYEQMSAKRSIKLRGHIKEDGFGADDEKSDEKKSVSDENSEEEEATFSSTKNEDEELLYQKIFRSMWAKFQSIKGLFSSLLDRVIPEEDAADKGIQSTLAAVLAAMVFVVVINKMIIFIP